MRKITKAIIPAAGFGTRFLPATKSQPKEMLPVVDKITPEIEAMVGGAGSALGTGGMQTKLHAAKIATEAGIDMIITNGQRPEDLYNIVAGEAIGTRFMAGAAQ